MNLKTDQGELSSLNSKKEKTEDDEHSLRELGDSIKHPSYIWWKYRREEEGAQNNMMK